MKTIGYAVKHSIDKLNGAFKAVDEGDVAFRYVIDRSTIHGKEEGDSLRASVGL